MDKKDFLFWFKILLKIKIFNVKLKVIRVLGK